jgi:hypothetical protein
MGGETLTLERPEVIPVASVSDAFPPNEQRTHRIFRVEQCARFRRVGSTDATKHTDAT